MTRDADHIGANGSAPAHEFLAERVAAYADGELDAALALEVEAHLAECEACRRELKVQQAVRDRLRREAGSEPPAAFRERVVRAVEAAPPRPVLRLRPWFRASQWPVLAAAAALAVLLVGLVARDRREAAPGPADAAAIRGLVEAHAAAWNRRDARAAAAILTPDAVWMTAAGEVLRGREEIERAHARWMAEADASGGNTHVHPAGSVNIQFLGGDIALVDVESQFLAQAGPGETGALQERTATFMVVTRDGGAWRVAHVRNTALSLF